MKFFHRKISFVQHDPLGNGLSDEIAAEQAEPDRIILSDEDGQHLTDFWDGVSKNLKKDPDWFDYNNE